MRLFHSLTLLWLACAIFYADAQGQTTSASEWRTDSYNAQRDGWQWDEIKITKANVGSLQLLWKLKTDSKSMGMQSFRQPLIVTTTLNGASNVQTGSGQADPSANVYPNSVVALTPKELKVKDWYSAVSAGSAKLANFAPIQFLLFVRHSVGVLGFISMQWDFTYLGLDIARGQQYAW